MVCSLAWCCSSGFKSKHILVRELGSGYVLFRWYHGQSRWSNCFWIFLCSIAIPNWWSAILFSSKPGSAKLWIWDWMVWLHRTPKDDSFKSKCLQTPPMVECDVRVFHLAFKDLHSKQVVFQNVDSYMWFGSFSAHIQNSLFKTSCLQNHWWLNGVSVFNLPFKDLYSKHGVFKTIGG